MVWAAGVSAGGAAAAAGGGGEGAEESGRRGGAGCLADGGLSWKDWVIAAALLATAA